MLASGRPHRVRLHVPEGHVRAVRTAHGDEGQKRLLADVAHRLRSMGFPEVMSIMQDPTASERCTAIARFKGPLHKDGVIRIEGVEEVAEPPDANPGTTLRGPDEGLTPEESALVLHALRSEDNPRHLSGMASSFAPFFPISASLLLARSNLLDVRAIGTRARLSSANGAAASYVVDAASRRFGLPREELQRQLLRPHEPPAGDLALAMESLGDPTWRSVTWSSATPRESWALRHRLRAMRDAARASGGAASIAAVTPMGGPGGPEADRVRQASLADLYGITRGRTFEERAADHALAMREGGPDKNTWSALLARRLAEVDGWARANPTAPREVLQDEVRRAVWTICSEPETLEGEPGTLLFFPPEIVALARCLVREVGWGVWIADPRSLEIALPPTGREGFVSPSALQLSLATQKPHSARVWNISKVREKLSALEAEGASPDALRAQNQLERADRAIERRRWIEWYRRAAPMGMRRLRRRELR